MKIIKSICKIVLAGITASIILSGFLFLYDIMPVHYENKKGNTDYVWQSNAIWVKLTEGISWGRFDSDGFNNPVVIKNPDIIILGSSHMEATNIFYNQTVTSLLANKLNDRYSVYNLGISGHHFFKVCQYLPINLKMHDTAPKIAIIETSSVNVSEENVQKVFNFEVDHTPSHATGLVGILQKIPVFRCLYHQFEGGLLNIFMQRDSTPKLMDDEEVVEDVPHSEIDETAYDELFSYLAGLEKEFGTQIIIFYHPTETLTETGCIEFQSGKALEAFEEYAEKYGIDFIDMTTHFEEMYNKDHLVAHGFVTGRLGQGHLNANGHHAVADELLMVIDRLEKEGVLCK